MKRIVLLIAGMLALIAESAAQPTINSLITNGLVEPFGIAVDSNNTAYIADSANHLLWSYNSDNGLLTSLAGINGQNGLVNGPGFVATFYSPKGIVLARGGLVVADSANNVLRFVTLTGSVSIVSTLAGTGVPGYLDGPGTSAQFNNPVGLAVDGNGNILIADSKNNVIRKMDANNFVSTLVPQAAGLSQPSGVALDPSGQIYIADTRNNAIKYIGLDGNVRVLAGSGSRVTGTNDSIFAEEALFNSPSSIIWVGGSIGLLVSDSGNQTLRQIYFNPILTNYFTTYNGHAVSGYSVSTYAGLPQQAGLQDGFLGQARLNSPMDMALDTEGGLLITDLGNHAVRRIQTTPLLPPVNDPVIGVVNIVTDQTTGKSIMQLSAFTDALFNNDVVIAAKAEARTTTLYTTGVTPGLFEPDTIPAPKSGNSQTAPSYTDGGDPSLMPASMVSAQPDQTIKAVGTASGRRPSNVVTARVQFQASAPTISGDNPASFTITEGTTNAAVWYTTDGSDPTNAPPSTQVGFSAQGSSAQVQLIVSGTNTITFKARAFKTGYQSSSISTKTFDPSSFQANQISFGFQSGEASSEFLASPGQKFMAPVTLTLLPNTKIASLQMSMWVTNNLSAPAVSAGNVGFESFLERNVTASVFVPINPAFFYDIYGTNPISVIPSIVPPSNLFDTNTFRTNRIFLEATNSSLPSYNLVAVGWLEMQGASNLYDSSIQDLVKYSQPHVNQFLSANGAVVVGGFSFVVPTTAVTGQSYTIQLLRPSATSDGLTADLYIQSPTNGSPGIGAINSIKTVTVGPAGSPFYVVGDSEPFRWFNSGDFGDTNLLNNDVMDVFMAAAYKVNAPPSGTDFFDAMDSCCNDSNHNAINANIYLGTDNKINLMAYGDGTLDVGDLYVTFRRSLDPSLTWYKRFRDVNGILQSVPFTPNHGRGTPDLPAESITPEMQNTSKLASGSNSSEPPFVRFRAASVPARSGQVIDVPIRAEVHGGYPVRVLLMNVTVEPLDGAPPITAPVQFTPSMNLGIPGMIHSAHPANYAGAWLNSSTAVAGVTGASDLIGTLRVQLPASASAEHVYRVHFESVSSSPNGLGVLPQELEDGLITFADHSASSWGDGIPDSWRLQHFGTASLANLAAAPEADPDGDGMPNWAEFLAGTNPSDPHSNLQLQVAANAPNAGGDVALHWRSTAGKRYAVEYSSSAVKPQWTVLADNLAGSGGLLEMRPPSLGTRALFFRVRVADSSVSPR